MGCKSDSNTLGLEKGNPEATPMCPRGAIPLYLENISVTCIHMNKIELLVPNTKIQKDKHKQFENYMIFNFTHDICETCNLSILDGKSPTSPGAKSYRNKRTYKKFEDVIK
jgi:hypothetical protein